MNYVADVCRALIGLAECDGAAGEAVNIGTGAEASVYDIFTMICEIMGAHGVRITRDETRVRPEGSEVRRLVCDNAKMRRLTGFSPRYALGDGLRETVAWFLKDGNLSRYKKDIYNI
jgi:nucleoside-diphosphate-sugar epimerase